MDGKRTYSARYFWILNVIGLTVFLITFAAIHVRTGPDVLQFLGEKSPNFVLLAGAVLLLFTKRLWMHGVYVTFALAVMTYTSLMLTIR